MTHSSDLRSRYDEERNRAQEQSQILYLQNQIDELRRQIKDTNNKYTWAMEQVRKNEALIGQVQSIVDKATEDNLQSLEAYRRELTALRKELANALVKIEEAIKPIRELQTQIHHIGEQRKRDQAQASLWLSRIEVLESTFQDLDTRIRENDERHRQILLQLDRLREIDEATNLEIRRIHEELQIEKQTLRRQAIEAQQMVADAQSGFHDLASRLGRHDELIQMLNATVEALPEQIDLIVQQIPEMIAEIKRVERVSTDRFLLTQERLEELRGQQDEKISDLRSAEQEHNHELQAWLERVDTWCREHEARLARAQTRLEALRVEHMERLQDIETRERRLLDTLLSALRQLSEQQRAEKLAAEPEPSC
ncbi:MAG: hypothetical protein KatS3mg057_1948 [Herpetosiphonaceae bacterium]|nr:MAG: hypothetical protein KatS3mg057_1948 [Herpetosiphonaceae bacterium]